MRDRAPDGQPTESIKRMMDYAEKELRAWERVELTAARSLKTANEQQAHYSRTLASLRRQYDTRLQEERNGQ